MKRLTMPCVDKNVKQLLYKVKHLFLPNKNAYGSIIQNDLNIENI